MNVFFLVPHLAIAILLISCGNRNSSTKINTKKSNLNDTLITTKILEKFPEDGYNTLFTFDNENAETIRIYTSTPSVHDKYFLADTINFIIAAKYKNAKLIQSDTIIVNEYTYTNVDSSSIWKNKVNGGYYVFITIREGFMGQAITEKSVYFHALNLIDLTIEDLVYEGKHSLRCDECIDGSFINFDMRDASPIKKELYQYALKSKWIHTPSEQDNAISYYKNYEEKWNKDNKADNALANGHVSIPQKIFSTYYKDDLFEYTGEYAKNEAIENDRYKIVSYFRNNIIGYDKEKKLYFPIFIESCITGCNKTINFTSENEIEVTYTEDDTESYSVHLNKIKFRK